MEALGRMTRGLIHDINNSLASIMGYADFLVTDLPADSEQFIFAENIKKSGLQLQDLIDQIRAISAENSKTKDNVVNIVDVVDDIATRLQALLGSKQSISFTSDIAIANRAVPFFQLKTLLGNLIVNAIQALGQQEGHVNIHISHLSAGDQNLLLNMYDSVSELEKFTPVDDPFITIQISDNGCGMTEDILLHSPMPHFTTKSSDTAHGMGIPVAREITSYLGGGLTIATSEGIGTHVFLTLPVDHIENMATESEVDQKSVLLVEDRDSVLQAIKTMLQRQSHNVTAVTDGLSALDILRENPKAYDLFITDYTMPHINGKDLLVEIREDFKTLPVIIMSGDRDHLERLKNDPHYQNIVVLQKPVSPQNLKRAIRSFHLMT